MGYVTDTYPMRFFVVCTLFCLFSMDAMAQASFILHHQVVDVQAQSTGTRITYKIVLDNPSSHSYHSLRLRMEDVALSLVPELKSLEFNTLPAGGSKQRFLTVTSSQRGLNPHRARIYLFHLQASDESGLPVTQLLRSEELPR